MARRSANGSILSAYDSSSIALSRANMPLTAPGARIHVGVARSVAATFSGACRFGHAYTCFKKLVVASENGSNEEVL
ncbi:hypothetical protein D3C86_2049220 [compost metagenome]